MGKKKATYKKKRRTGNPSGRKGTSHQENEPTSSAKSSDSEVEASEMPTTTITPQRAADRPVEESKSKLTASESKLKAEEEEMEFDSDSNLTGFRFVDCELVLQFVSSLLCPNCEMPIGADTSEVRTGLASKFVFDCQCGKKLDMFTLKKCNKFYEVNRRFPTSMFAIGRHQTHAKKFLGNMNIPGALNNTSWSNHKQQIIKATESVARESKSVAAAEIKTVAGTDVTVSCDGTYQRRGFQSKNGVVTVLSVNGQNSKVLDNAVLSNHCDSCKKQKKKREPADFEIWKLQHKNKGECDQNHVGSAAAMVPAGAMTAFRRSQQLHGLRYINFLGDGDSKTFSSLKNAFPAVYPQTDINKLECCGHVQKRMGRQLTNKVTELKLHRFDHNGKIVKGIGGKGGLTKKAILNIRGHYGAAIRKNAGNIDKMRNDIWAIWRHRRRDHRYCGNWCPSKTGKGDPDKNALPDYVTDAILPVFETLSQDSLLSKCLHGGSQNTNESFHNVIWQRCPKTIFVGKKRIQLAVDDATIVYNDGECGRFAVFEKLGMEVGVWTRLCFKEMDRNRVKGAQIQATDAAKFARKNRALEAAGRDEGREEFYLSGAHE